MKPKKIPLRMCVGCMQMKPKGELIRVVKTPDEDVVLDITGKKNGRGAYVCKSKNCLMAAIKAKRLERTFKMPVPYEVYDRLSEEMEHIES